MKMKSKSSTQRPKSSLSNASSTLSNGTSTSASSCRAVSMTPTPSSSGLGTSTVPQSSLPSTAKGQTTTMTMPGGGLPLDSVVIQHPSKSKKKTPPTRSASVPVSTSSSTPPNNNNSNGSEHGTPLISNQSTVNNTSSSSSTSSSIRKTNIQVCIRVRPILPSDSHVSQPSSSANSNLSTGTGTNTGTGNGSTEVKKRLFPPLPDRGDTNTNNGTSSSNGRTSALRRFKRAASHRTSRLSGVPSPSPAVPPPPPPPPSTPSSVETSSQTSSFFDDDATVASLSTCPNQNQVSPDTAPLQPAWTVHPDNSTLSQNVPSPPHSSSSSNDPSSNTNTNPRKSTYSFDHAYGPEHSTAELYEKTVRDVVHAAMEGYHASVFAYGQTSTGKTYTMTGSSTGTTSTTIGLTKTAGIIQLAVRDCFGFIQDQSDEREYLLRVSFMEIYNEGINDLLQPRTGANGTSATTNILQASPIRIFESKNEGVIIRGLKEEIVTSPEQVFGLLMAGEKRRHTGSTNLNKQSSRSHSIFRLIVESRARGRIRRDKGNGGSDAEMESVHSASSSAVGADSIASSNFGTVGTATTAGGGIGGPVRVSSLSLVDLAGSESVKATGAIGKRKKEGQYINKSLMTLGHVVWKLSEASQKMDIAKETGVPLSREDMSALTHIPYRDSKLTRLLQPSLSGNAQICIICNISPLAKHMDESINTLKFASRAKRIKQHAVINEVLDEKTLLQNYREEIEDLKAQLKEAKAVQANLAKKKKDGEEEERAAGGGDGDGDGDGDPTDAQAPTDGNSSKSSEAGGYDEDSQVLVQAIQNLERLILKTSTAEKKKKKKKKKNKTSDKNSKADGRNPEKNANADADDDSDGTNQKNPLPRVISTSTGGGDGSATRRAKLPPAGRPPRQDSRNSDDLLREDDDDELLESMNVSAYAASQDSAAAAASSPSPPAPRIDRDDGMMRSSTRTSPISPFDDSSVISRGDMSIGDETSVMQGSKLVAELHRIQGLLGSVLKRKGGASAGGGSAQKTPSTPLPPIPSSVLESASARDQEVERLRAQLHEQAVATSLRKADSSFLQSQLQQKDNLLKEVSKILEAVEQRQVQLERENVRMKQEWARTMAILKSREADVTRTMTLLRAREGEIARLKRDSAANNSPGKDFDLLI